MKTIIFILTVLCFVLTTNAQYTKDNLRLEAAGKLKYRYRNLQLYPIYASAAFVAQHKNVGKYVVLKDALEKKNVTITESNGGEVNTLFMENTSKDTIMVLSGEVVQGGKQDRMIA